MNLPAIIKRIIPIKHEKEPWQISAARYCVEQSEETFTKDGLSRHILSLYKVNKSHIEQFWNEEIVKPSGREFSRDPIKGGIYNVWIPPLDLVAKITDYDELREARKNAKQAFWLSILAIIISSITLYTSARLGENQLEQSQEQVQLQNAIWNYEQMRNDRIEVRDVQWRQEDLQSQGRLPD